MKKDFRNFSIEDYKLCIGGFDVNWFSKYLKETPKLILEFGSYDGGDGVRYKTTFPDCKVISIEACPKRFSLIKELENKFSIEAHNYAVCDIDGQIEFFQVEDNNVTDNDLKCGSSGSINARTDFYKKKFPHINEKPSILVNSIRLDTFCQKNQIQNIDLVHCDVEGAEHRVVKGMGSMRPKLLWLEMHLGKKFYGENAYDAKELDLHLRDIGYSMVETNGKDCLYYFNQ